MASFNLRIRTLVATVILILISSTSPVASVALERRQDMCNPQVENLTPHDCNVAFYNLGFSGENKMLRGPGAVNMNSGTCRVIVDCPGQTSVSAGRLLNNVGTPGGFVQLQNVCTSQGKAGQIFVEGGCQVRTERA
ncbi:hypothetical protein MJO28_002820 [Puccinia striiformis f. sp. tritici]|uniref:Secreted protein n=4 Tax=Puccinia striiformis TaxID=27350 RepID=A0A0L0VK16_9BASI|nr:hypothetical protein MJO28_002820 [Puccinia striiformis f. sp. tritici]KAI9619297.1 hypothetical protein H4Q26_011980 [Puccinia striiformis f. sp. tritici PST-130]KNE99620.1 hypothetical protein PSTG_07113 [Puccinia striiformis f. sp. tritici PST-78]POW01055.1 hypothetical protein PSTT_12772 [Puccinia striiformis]POW20337.1 hypothetical protein PSHT_03690 [Puccinia striiformis]